MITVITKQGFCKVDGVEMGALPQDCQGLSSDQKPTDVMNGATFYEMDTKKAFMFDEQHNMWYEV